MSARPHTAIFGGVSVLKNAKEFILRDNRQWSCGWPFKRRKTGELNSKRV